SSDEDKPEPPTSVSDVAQHNVSYNLITPINQGPSVDAVEDHTTQSRSMSPSTLTNGNDENEIFHEAAFSQEDHERIINEISSTPTTPNHLMKRKGIDLLTTPQGKTRRVVLNDGSQQFLSPGFHFTTQSTPTRPYPAKATDLLLSDPSDFSYEFFSSPLKSESRIFGYDYFEGDGRLDSEVDENWDHNGVPIGEALLEFRARVIEKNYALSEPYEKLAVNFIFLMESKDQTGGLQSEIDDDVWEAVWEAIGPLEVQLSSPEVVVESHTWAHQAATLEYQKFVERLRQAPPSSATLRQILNRMTSTHELWTHDDENESSYLKNTLAPLLDTYFGTIPRVNTKWTPSLDETKTEGSRLLIPDYSVTTLVGPQTYSLLHLEGKTVKNSGASQIWDDLTKLGQELKYSLDSMVKLQPRQSVSTQGILVQGFGYFNSYKFA
ncbi:hypothetical protein BGX27_000547, partial [Mortierella sp. AM989]